MEGRRAVKLLRLSPIFALLFASNLLFANPFSGSVSLYVLDAGHGGSDPGAISSGINEKDVTLSVAKKVARLLEAAGKSVYETRPDDVFVELQTRSDLANSKSFDISGYPVFVSIHVNSASNGDASGFEVFTRQGKKRIRMTGRNSSSAMMLKYSPYTDSQLQRFQLLSSRKIAETVVSEVGKEFPEMKMRGIKEENLWVLNSSFMPSILIELGFISSDEERRNLISDSWQERMARAIADALLSL